MNRLGTYCHQTLCNSRQRTFWLAAVTLLAALSPFASAEDPAFRAGAAAVDITPTAYPVRVNGMFTERSADASADPLYARAMALDDGQTRILFCIVDTCMMAQALIDEAKAATSEQTGIPADRMMVSATHTHSAPSAMGCLGSRQDPDYAAWLPGKIAEALAAANKALQPARVGWAAVDDWEHTHNRRWIRRADKTFEDPFGNWTVRAHMHPGYESPDVIGPSGPVDPELSVLAATTPEGAPIAFLANYSQHYYRSPLLSADYFGAFARTIAGELGQPSSEGPFVAMMSQGTSGDLMWMDYGSPRQDGDFETYADEVAARAMDAWEAIEWQDAVSLGMVEKTINLAWRVPDEDRLAWARKRVEALAGALPETKPDIYAHEAIILHERQRTDLKLQALRIGDLTIATLPNEVYAITGLKLKRQAPLGAHFNIGLANDSVGYIPPPEQHELGGYTTWPARTAGLEVQAEPTIVETLLGALEEVADKSRRPIEDGQSPYAGAVADLEPVAYWRLNEIEGRTAHSALAERPNAQLSGGTALYLPGAGSGSGTGDREQLVPSAFSGPEEINRAVHFVADGQLTATVPDLQAPCTVAFWFWLGEKSGASIRDGGLVTLPSGDNMRYTVDEAGTTNLFLARAGDPAARYGGRTPFPLGGWHLAVVVADGTDLHLYLDGIQNEPEATRVDAEPFGDGPIRFGEGLEGKLDEIAVFNRALDAGERTALWEASGMGAPPAEEAALAQPEESAPATPQVSVPPRDPEAGLASIYVPDGYTVDLVASEPQVLDPVAFDWDARGRLWVVEMADYPLGLDGEGAAGGRVRILEDKDQDGTYESSFLFAEGLNFPTGILTWRGGAIVTAAPDIVYLRDTSGDGVANEREVLLTGLSEGNQQLRANGLRWGLDNWVYVAAGGHHGKYALDTKLHSTRAGTETRIGSRDFRFRPDTGEVEPQSGPSQFGRNRDDWGHWFGTQNSRPLWHYALPDHYLSRNPHFAAPDGQVQVLGEVGPPVYPASALQKRFHDFKASGNFTSACSGMIYRDATLFPAGEIQGFTCEPFHNLVQRIALEPDGVTFTGKRAGAEDAPDFFASEDRWCRPVMVRTGPDGGLWVADMYRYMIEHPQWLPEEGRAELLPHYREGDDRGRIYRVRPTATTPAPAPKLDGLSTLDLVGQLASTNGWVRDKVQQMILWQPDADAVPLLESMARDHAAPRARLHALCTLDGLGALADDLVVQALADAHPGVRENALRLAETRDSDAVVEAALALAGDPEPKVRQQLAFSIGAFPAKPETGRALAEVLLQGHGDPLLTAAALSSALPHQQHLVAELVSRDHPALPDMRLALAEIALGAGNTSALAALLTPVFREALDAPSQETANASAAMLDLLARRETSVPTLAESADGLEELENTYGELITRARETLGEDSAPDATRIAAATILARIPAEETAAVDYLLPQVDGLAPPEELRQTLATLAHTTDERVPARIIEAWPGLVPRAREAAVEVLLSRTAWTRRLIEAIGKRGIRPTDLAPVRRTQLLNHPDKDLRALAEAQWEAATESARAEVVAAYQAALKLEADLENGRAKFAELCAQCHKKGDIGYEIGPQLRTFASHPKEKLLANILDPNLDIQPGYHAYNCETQAGELLFGLITAENATSITMKLPGGKVRTVMRDDIYELESTAISMMPDGLEAALSHQDMADLLAFLKQ